METFSLVMFFLLGVLSPLLIAMLFASWFVTSLHVPHPAVARSPRTRRNASKRRRRRAR